MFQYYYNQGHLFISGQDYGKKNYDLLTIPYYFASNYLVETLVMSTEIVVLLFIFIGLLMYNPIAVLFLIVFIIPIFGLVYLKLKTKLKE
ncbi:MAG: hypothetical protein IPO37_04030 [Saprospiraceae bacterium]|nr:hypothetical protein [Saprospiraceae bacterium]